DYLVRGDVHGLRDGLGVAQRTQRWRRQLRDLQFFETCRQACGSGNDTCRAGGNAAGYDAEVAFAAESASGFSGRFSGEGVTVVGLQWAIVAGVSIALRGHGGE